MSKQLYQCPECGLHYKDKTTSEACEAFCRQNQACSMEIAKKSVEREAKV
jgi:transposase-like protein